MRNMDSRKPLTAGEIEEAKKYSAWLHSMSEKHGKGGVLYADGRGLGRAGDSIDRLLSLLTPPPDAAVREAVEKSGKSESVAYINGAAPDDIADHLLSAGYTMSEDESVAGQVLYTFTDPAGAHAFFFIEYDKDHTSDIDKLRDENKMLWAYAVAHMDAANAAMNFGGETDEYGDDNPAEFETPEDATALIKRCLKEAALLRAVQAPRLTGAQREAATGLLDAFESFCREANWNASALSGSTIAKVNTAPAKFRAAFPEAFAGEVGRG